MKKNPNRLIKLGQMTELEAKLSELEIRCDNIIKNINFALFMDDGMESIDIASASVAFNDLKKTVYEYHRIKEEIKKLKEM